MGNHAVQGVDGRLADIETEEIICFQAPLRAQTVLEARMVDHGRRAKESALPGRGGGGRCSDGGDLLRTLGWSERWSASGRPTATPTIAWTFTASGIRLCLIHGSAICSGRGSNKSGNVSTSQVKHVTNRERIRLDGRKKARDEVHDGRPNTGTSRWKNPWPRRSLLLVTAALALAGGQLHPVSVVGELADRWTARLADAVQATCGDAEIYTTADQKLGNVGRPGPPAPS